MSGGLRKAIRMCDDATGRLVRLLHDRVSSENETLAPLPHLFPLSLLGSSGGPPDGCGWRSKANARPPLSSASSPGRSGAAAC